MIEKIISVGQTVSDWAAQKDVQTCPKICAFSKYIHLYFIKVEFPRTLRTALDKVNIPES